MFVVFWRDTQSPRDIESGFDQFETLDSREEAAAKFAALCLLPSTYCAGWAPITGDATEPQWLESNAPTLPVFDAMAAEFSAWLVEHGLDGESDCAMGYLMRPDLSTTERQWLSDFVRRWDSMESERDSILKALTLPDQMEGRRNALNRRLIELG